MENDDSYFLMYSAGASWTADYSTSMMGISKKADPLRTGKWWRSDRPVFARNDAEGVYGPGHASFTTSPNGTEHWIVYHALNDSVIHLFYVFFILNFAFFSSFEIVMVDRWLGKSNAKSAAIQFRCTWISGVSASSWIRSRYSSSFWNANQLMTTPSTHELERFFIDTRPLNF
jgi:hypothetical protein